MNTEIEIQNALAYCTGTEKYYRVQKGSSFVFTDGVRMLADMAESHWLITAIMSHQITTKVLEQDFQVWILKPNGEQESGWSLICEDGYKNEVTRQEIEYSDFPLKEGIKLFMVNTTLLLPSEY